ncbi:MAG: hypothetical protein ABI216_04005 [Devosia sp.]
MRYLTLAALLATALTSMPAVAADEPQGQMVVLKASQIGQIFCLSRLGNDEAVIQGILTDDLHKAIDAAEVKDGEFAKKYPGDKPPLGDGIGWQSSLDYGDTCDVGVVTLSKTDAKVEIKYTFTGYPDGAYTDTLILKKVPIDGMDVAYWRIDDVIYPDGSDLKSGLVTAFDTY